MFFSLRKGGDLRLATIKREGSEIAAVITEVGALPLEVIDRSTGNKWPADILSLLGSGGLDELRERHAKSGGFADLSEEAIPPARVEYGPLYRRPRKIWGIGLNYTEHAGDLEVEAPVTEPASFMRPDTTIIGPGDEIRLPPQSERVTGEAELGIIIGCESKDLDEDQARSAVAGFTTLIDMTAEDILRKNPRYLTRAKSFDTFFSFGPHLVTPDEVGEVGSLEVETVLNGETERENVVSNMMFSPWSLVSFHSRVMTLLPGDVICTGTPGAVVLRDGDVVGCAITGFEPLENPVRR